MIITIYCKHNKILKKKICSLMVKTGNLHFANLGSKPNISILFIFHKTSCTIS